MPRVAALLDVAPLSDVTAVVDAQTFVRPIFAGSIEVTLRDEEPVVVASIRATAFDPCERKGEANNSSPDKLEQHQHGTDQYFLS